MTFLDAVKYLDLLLHIDGKPIIVFENKIAVGFTTHDGQVVDGAIRVVEHP